MRSRPLLFLLLVVAVLLASCSSTKPLKEGQYMLTRNNVQVLDERSPDFDNLKSYVRPVTNKRFMEIFSLKTMCYSAGQPTYKKDGQVRDSRMRQLLRNRIGEPPVLLDTNDAESSVKQINTVMAQLGYFDSEVNYQIVHRRTNPKKVRVDYLVTAHDAYRIRKINYQIDIPEYRKIVVLHKNESLLHEGMQYNESLINDEFTRIVNLLRDEGYYNVEKSIIRAEVAYDTAEDSTMEDPKSVTLDIILKFNDETNHARYLYKYYFDNVYIMTNFDANAPQNQLYDTVMYQSRSKRDTNIYYFITPHQEGFDDPVVDFHYRTIADAIFTESGRPFSQALRRRSSLALNQLGNFSYYSITYKENLDKLDTVNHVGYLDAIYRLTRLKVHSVGGQLDLRNDKSAISVTYMNRNIFKGAEKLTLNLSGGYFYYSLANLFRRDNTYAYPEFGINASLDFPKLFLFTKMQKNEDVKYNTTLKFGVNYSGLYRRLMYNTSITYNWSPSYYINHSISPIDISTINMSDKRHANIVNYDDYSNRYQDRFGKYFLLSFKYNFNYLVPFSYEDRKNSMRISLNFESSGLLLKGLNRAITPDHRWVLSRNSLDSTGYNYSTFEKLDFTWNYTYKINRDNSFALRMNAGAIIPIDVFSQVPYEKGFYLGTSSSMRGWGYRGLGPGSYEHDRDSLYTGDVKLEWNMEYRGTIYRSFKYGLFADIGNIWLAKNDENMPGAKFKFSQFYKELAIDVGVGLRLDFDFFVIRVDYAVPIYDPGRTSMGRWINANWRTGIHPWKFVNGLKIAIGYAF